MVGEVVATCGECLLGIPHFYAKLLFQVGLQVEHRDHRDLPPAMGPLYPGASGQGVA